MKFTCPSCSAKYQISDDKLTGRLAKMKCRKCGHIIPIVTGPSDKSIAAAPVVRASSLKQRPLAPPSIPSQPDIAEWHAGIKGKPVGPLTQSDLAEKIQSGEVGDETFVWREGMDSWKLLPEVLELSGLLAPAPSPLPPPSMPSRAKAQAGPVTLPPKPQGLEVLDKNQAVAPAILAKAHDAPAPVKTAGKTTPEVPAPAAAPPPGSSAAQKLAESFGLDIQSTKPPQIKEHVQKIEVTKDKPESKKNDSDSTVPAVITEAPIPQIAMPGDGATSSRHGGLFSARPSYESLLAELKRRRKNPWAVPFLVATALVLGVTFGFVLFGGQETKIIKEVVEVPATVAEAKENPVTDSIPAPPEDSGPSEETTAKATPNVKTSTSGSATPSGQSAAAQPTEISKGLKGLSGLDGLQGPNAGPSGPSTSGGGQPLSTSQIQSTVIQYQSSVKRGCWQPALMSRDKDAPSTARVSVAIGVASDGRVVSATSSGDPKGYPGLSSCITSRVRGWRFPASGGSTTVNVPFVFAAQ